MEKVDLPHFPTLDAQGKYPRPLVTLIGNGEWQEGATRLLGRSAQAVIRTCLGGKGPTGLLPHVILDVLILYGEISDALLIHVPTDHPLVLDQWTVAAYFLGRCPDRVVIAVPDAAHAMAPGLIYVAQQAGACVVGDLELALGIVHGKCRTRREAANA